MTKKLITIIAAGALVLAACGSDSDDGASDTQEETEDTTAEVQEDAADTTDVVEEDAAEPPSNVQEEAANTLIVATEQGGIELDADCVNDLTSQLSDEDAQAIVDAEAESDAEVSVEGTAIVNQLLGCADNDQIIDAFIAEMQKSGQEFDEECVREGLQDIDLAELAASEDGQGGTRGRHQRRVRLLRTR